MTKRTKTELASQLTTLLPDNTNAEISPEDIRSVFTDYADSLVLWDSTAPTAAGAYASATITFSGLPGNNEEIDITDASGTEKTYTAKTAGEDTTFGHFNVSGSKEAAAASLKDCIDAGNGHNGTITVSDNGSGVLTLTQASTGTPGNTTITEELDNVTKTDFTGGVSAAPSCVKGEVVFVKGSNDYIYVCVDTNLWRRSELSSF